jgi:ABC-type dipeptide/oligopeptide/nickel transport system permease component
VLRYIARRALALAPILFGITVVTFVVLRVIPGDPVSALIDERAAGMDQHTIDTIRAQWGLDKPLPVQYVRFLASAVKGDFGRSFFTRQPVTSEILARMPATIRLAIAAMAIAVVAGMLLGIVAAVRRSTWLDSASMVVALSGLSIPVFWLALIMMYVLSIWLGILPASGYGSWRNLIMPAVALAAAPAAVIARITRSAMLEVVGSDYVTTARAKGLGERTVIWRHALRNALVPVVTILGLQVGGLLSGAVITETIFNWPGVGRLLIDSILRRDFPMVQGGVVLVAALFAIVNLATDLVYAVIDRRIRYT